MCKTTADDDFGYFDLETWVLGAQMHANGGVVPSALKFVTRLDSQRYSNLSRNGRSVPCSLPWNAASSGTYGHDDSLPYGNRLLLAGWQGRILISLHKGN